MRKLNFGCGDRISPGWTNIDFHSSDSRIQRANLLAGFPFPNDYFDAVYSSHVIEHFTRKQGLFLIKEARRVLRPGGVIRIVVPDLEESCKEYLRILNMSDSDSAKRPMYDWIIVELLDQLVRSVPSGDMGPMMNQANSRGNDQLMAYIRSRTENKLDSFPLSRSSSSLAGIKRLTPEKISTKLNYWYLKFIRMLIPAHLRSLVLIETRIGERHRWMYDRYGMKILFEDAGFFDCRMVRFDESSILHFNEDCLDVNPDGTSYKNISIYFEAIK